MTSTRGKKGENTSRFGPTGEALSEPEIRSSYAQHFECNTLGETLRCAEVDIPFSFGNDNGSAGKPGR